MYVSTYIYKYSINVIGTIVALERCYIRSVIISCKRKGKNHDIFFKASQTYRVAKMKIPERKLFDPLSQHFWPFVSESEKSAATIKRLINCFVWLASFQWHSLFTGFRVTNAKHLCNINFFQEFLSLTLCKNDRSRPKLLARGHNIHAFSDTTILKIRVSNL